MASPMQQRMGMDEKQLLSRLVFYIFAYYYMWKGLAYWHPTVPAILA